jgi:uncharacterized membrane protein YqaE (UPF0057 family)
MKTTTYLFVFFIAFVFTSCGVFNDISIEKRHYRKGYYVDVRKDREIEKAVAQENNNEKEPIAVTKATEENNTSAVENISHPSASSATSNAFAKEKTNHFSPPHIFKKGKALMQERKSVAAPKPVEPKPAHDDDADHAVALFLLIILAIILPPLAVLLADGLGVNFLIDLIFWLLSYGFVVFIPGGGFVYLGIFGLIAIIYALFVIFEVI